MGDRLRVAIVGAGLGGLTAASTLRQAGIDVDVYEQATRFARVGAGIQMSPNAVRVLRRIGLEGRLRSVAFQPGVRRNRDWDTGRMTFEFPLGDELERTYGAPYLMLHRGDLHEALAGVLPGEIIHLRRRLAGLVEDAAGVELRFEDGGTARADAAIGADGIHSRVRDIVLGPQAPIFTGHVAYRTVYPTTWLGGREIDPMCKWWGPDRHIVIYHVSGGREVYFTTQVPEDWSVESYSARGDRGELRAAYEGFHPDVLAVIEAPREVHKWAIYEREPLPAWAFGRVALLGDACHPMTPNMAQGAAVSMEDAAVLARSLAGVEQDGIEEAFRRYEAARKPRASRIQRESHLNRWLQKPMDTDWAYGYDAWEVPLDSSPVAP